MKKKSVIRIFFGSLFKSLLCIGLIFGVGVASYKISYYMLSGGINKVNIGSDSLQDIIEDATTDEISKNLIYVSNDKNKITNIMLEICNTKTSNMDYVTIPANTDYTIPSVMYRKLCQINEEIPQVIQVSKLKQYFAEEQDAYGYGVLIFEKMLGTDISYYTAINQETYKSHYAQRSVQVAFKTKTPADATPGPYGETPPPNTTLKTKMKISVLSDTYKNQLKNLGHDQKEIADYIKNQYERVVSNLTTYNKIGYVEAYEKMDVDRYHYWGIPGVYHDKVFAVDTKAAKKALKYLAKNTTTYAAAQDLAAENLIPSSGADSTPKKAEKSTSNPSSNSKGLRIYVLNGSQIAGLASSTKEKLENAGYTVPGIGNYTAETLTTTKIKVSKEGQGADLKEFFRNPEIAVGNVTEGYDIEIILGTVDVM